MNPYSFLDIVKTVITFIVWTIVATLLTLLGIPFALLPAKYRYSNRFYYFCGYLGTTLMVKATFIKLTIRNKENLTKYLTQPSIVICNHSSSVDIPLVQMLIGPNPHVWFSKVAYGKIPLFGFLLRRMHILISREHATKSARAIEQAKAITNNHNTHLLLFPEGMRHADGNIHRFFSGFAVMAIALHRPVVPMIVHGLHTVFPKDTFVIRSSQTKVTLSIGKPMWYTDGEAPQDFMHRVHAWYQGEIEKLKE